jgi:DNA (cytosine-5)-methyltransferase 1
MSTSTVTSGSARRALRQPRRWRHALTTFAAQIRERRADLVSVVDVVDLFSGGGGGWCLAARALGLISVGLEWDGPSCKTRAAADLLTIRADVASYPPERFAGVAGITGGPPCQSFSSAGKRKGLADPRGQLVHEPMRWVRVVGPRWVALEQVPEVLGYWRWMARELRDLGYSAWTGILNAADYGVPQIRKRAILLASLDRRAQPPEPTHSRTGHDEMFGPRRERWVTMADALGWGLTERPAYVVAGGTDGGRHDGGARQREEIAKHQAEGRWVLRTGDNSAVGGHRPEDARRYERDLNRPAPTVKDSAGRCWKLVSPGRSYTSSRRRADPTLEPAPTIALGHNVAAWCWERPATTVQGDLRVAQPGHHDHCRDEDAIPVTIAELGVLQGFPADHPWQAPGRSAQVGNAIPPPLAEACLRAVAA